MVDRSTIAGNIADLHISGPGLSPTEGGARTKRAREGRYCTLTLEHELIAMVEPDKSPERTDQEPKRRRPTEEPEDLPEAPDDQNAVDQEGIVTGTDTFREDADREPDTFGPPILFERIRLGLPLSDYPMDMSARRGQSPVQGPEHAESSRRSGFQEASEPEAAPHTTRGSTMADVHFSNHDQILERLTDLGETVGTAIELLLGVQSELRQLRNVRLAGSSSNQ